MPRDYIPRLRFLIKKKRAGLITADECEELSKLLNVARKDDELSPGGRIAASLTLATLTGKAKPRELTS